MPFLTTILLNSLFLLLSMLVMVSHETSGSQVDSFNQLMQYYTHSLPLKNTPIGSLSLTMGNLR